MGHRAPVKAEAFFWLPEITTDDVFELAHLHAFLRIEGIKVIQTDLHAAHVPFVFSCVFVVPLNIRRDGVVFTEKLQITFRILVTQIRSGKESQGLLVFDGPGDLLLPLGRYQLGAPLTMVRAY